MAVGHVDLSTAALESYYVTHRAQVTQECLNVIVSDTQAAAQTRARPDRRRRQLRRRRHRRPAWISRRARPAGPWPASTRPLLVEQLGRRWPPPSRP